MTFRGKDTFQDAFFSPFRDERDFDAVIRRLILRIKFFRHAIISVSFRFYVLFFLAHPQSANNADDVDVLNV